MRQQTPLAGLSQQPVGLGNGVISRWTVCWRRRQGLRPAAGEPVLQDWLHARRVWIRMAAADFGRGATRLAATASSCGCRSRPQIDCHAAPGSKARANPTFATGAFGGHAGRGLREKFQIELGEQELLPFIGPGVAGEDQGAPAGGREVDVAPLHGAEWLEDGARGEAGRLQTPFRAQGGVQAEGQKTRPG